MAATDSCHFRLPVLMAPLAGHGLWVIGGFWAGPGRILNSGLGPFVDWWPEALVAGGFSSPPHA